MKRDLDLIREILLAIEDHEPATIGRLQTITPRDFSGTEPQSWHHIRMLIDANLINAAGRPTMQGEFAVHGLTMEGHDFLSAIRDKTIWDHTKARMTKAGGWTLDLVLAVAKEELKRRLFGGGAS